MRSVAFPSGIFSLNQTSFPGPTGVLYDRTYLFCFSSLPCMCIMCQAIVISDSTVFFYCFYYASVGWSCIFTSEATVATVSFLADHVYCVAEASMCVFGIVCGLVFVISVLKWVREVGSNFPMWRGFPAIRSLYDFCQRTGCMLWFLL